MTAVCAPRLLHGEREDDDMTLTLTPKPSPSPRTLTRVKEKMRTHCGTGSAFMHLTLMNEHKQVVADMSDDSLMLGYFSPQVTP